eukprot:289313_1
MTEQVEPKVKEAETEEQQPKNNEELNENPPKQNEEEPKKDEQEKEPQNDVSDEKKGDNISEAKEKEIEIERPNFSGIWVLKTNENLDNFMKSQGIGYLKRKLLAMASITLTLEHKGNILHAKVKLPIGEVDEKIPLDGTDKETTNPMGDKIKMSANWSEDKNKPGTLVIKTYNYNKKNATTLTRVMPDENTLKDTMSNQSGVSMTRTFKRKQ